MIEVVGAAVEDVVVTDVAVVEVDAVVVVTRGVVVSPPHAVSARQAKAMKRRMSEPSLSAERKNAVMGERFDVVVVGARVAGCVAAIGLAERGHRVLLVDRAALPSSTLSTHFFRGGRFVAVLQDLGVLDEVLALGAPKLVRQWTTVGDGVATEAGPQTPGEIGFCLSVRRQPLDEILLRRAAAVPGVTIRDRTKVTSLEIASDFVSLGLEGPDEPRDVSAALVVGADGRHSFVAKAVGAPVQAEEDGHRALYYAYAEGWLPPVGSELDAAEFSFQGDEVAYVFPSDAGQTCIALSVNQECFSWMKADLEVRFRERLATHAAFGSRSEKATFTSRVLGVGMERNVVRVAAADRWALVGDAGQHQDPWTGAGMDLAGVTAQALARHYGDWLDGDITLEDATARYREERDALSRSDWESAVTGSRDIAALFAGG